MVLAVAQINSEAMYGDPVHNWIGITPSFLKSKVFQPFGWRYHLWELPEQCRWHMICQSSLFPPSSVAHLLCNWTPSPQSWAALRASKWNQPNCAMGSWWRGLAEFLSFAVFCSGFERYFRCQKDGVSLEEWNLKVIHKDIYWLLKYTSWILLKLNSWKSRGGDLQTCKKKHSTFAWPHPALMRLAGRRMVLVRSVFSCST